MFKKAWKKINKNDALEDFLSKDFGIENAGPVPISLLSRQDLEGSEYDEDVNKGAFDVSEEHYPGSKYKIVVKEEERGKSYHAWITLSGGGLVEYVGHFSNNDVAMSSAQRVYDRYLKDEGLKKSFKHAWKDLSKSHLEDEIADEIDGAQHYEELANEETANASIFSEMADDERQHKENLEEMEVAEKSYNISQLANEMLRLIEGRGWKETVKRELKKRGVDELSISEVLNVLEDYIQGQGYKYGKSFKNFWKDSFQKDSIDAMFAQKVKIMRQLDEIYSALEGELSENTRRGYQQRTVELERELKVIQERINKM